MRLRTFGLPTAAVLAASMGFVAAGANASAFDVSVDSAPLSGNPAVLVFDFIDGGSPSNTVVLYALTSNGTQGPVSTTGNVTGTGPWTFSDVGPSFFNELQVPYNPMGPSLSFSFATTDNAPDPGSLPDAFSFFILDTDLITPLITTNDPTGADSLFLYSIGQGLGVYTADQHGFSIQVTPSQTMPEPGTLLLFCAAVGVFIARRRFTT
jgi:hypothetical protein